MSESSLDLALRTFREVLLCGWAGLGDLAEHKRAEPDQFRADWAQVNWEAIVEAAVSDGGVFLEPYGDGADCNSVGSRVWMPGVKSTHAVICHPSVGLSVRDRLTAEEVPFPEEGLLLDRFACVTSEGWWSEHPPFDHVLTLSREKGEALFRLTEVKFAVRRVVEE